MIMPRIKGAFNYTRDQVKFIKDNWKVMSDKRMSSIIKIPASSIQRCRTRMGLSRYEYTVKDNATIAYICELYIMGAQIKEICGIVGKSSYNVSRYIAESLFGTPHTENTETRTFQSKINDNENNR